MLRCTPAVDSAVRRFRVDVSKNSSTAASSREGAFDTSTTTEASFLIDTIQRRSRGRPHADLPVRAQRRPARNRERRAKRRPCAWCRARSGYAGWGKVRAFSRLTPGHQHHPQTADSSSAGQAVPLAASLARPSVAPGETMTAAASDQPGWMDPELATLTQDRFSDPAWIFERKLDGERCLAFRSGKPVRLMTRNQKDDTSTYPEITEALAAQRAGDFIIDGEI